MLDKEYARNNFVNYLIKQKYQETKKLINLKLITPYPKELEVHMQELYKRLPEKNRQLYAGVGSLETTLWWYQLYC